jgi:hypothetical protein
MPPHSRIGLRTTLDRSFHAEYLSLWPKIDRNRAHRAALELLMATWRLPRTQRKCESRTWAWKSASEL